MPHTWWHPRQACLVGLLVSLHSNVANAALPTEQPYRYVAVMVGDCERLILAGRDQTAGCNGKLVNVDFGDGRVAFVFTSPSASGPIVTTFLGRASIQKDLRSYRLEVDEIATTTIDAGGHPANIVESAAGYCTMIGDPTLERARFACAVERPSGATAATFLSAGEPTVYAWARRDEGNPETVAINPRR
jgi:hypothetical protein